MKLAWKLPKAEKWKEALKQYKYVLIVIVAGILLLLWPSGERKERTSENAGGGLTGQEEDFSVETLEEKLASALTKIDGAGEVSVVLTVKNGMERVLAVDRNREQSDDRYSLEEETVVISTDGGDEAVLITQKYPTFQGALVICEGGNDPAVQLCVTQAVAALTGLGTDRITVCQGR